MTLLAEKKCSFCGSKVQLGTGIMLVRNDGHIAYFCSSKCRKSSLKLRRDPRRLKWTLHYRKEASRS